MARRKSNSTPKKKKATKKAQKKTPKKAAKPKENPININQEPERNDIDIDRDDFEFVLGDDASDDFDEDIENLEASLLNKPNELKRKLVIQDYVDDQAKEKKDDSDEEDIPKTTKLRKIWTPSEAALLKILLSGTSPIGKNASALTAALNREIKSCEGTTAFTQKEVKNKLETNLFSKLNYATPFPSVPVPVAIKQFPVLDNPTPHLEFRYETPHIIDTDRDRMLLIWPSNQI